MKKFLLFAALVLLTASLGAQSRYNYDSAHKYGFFSNWRLGPFGQASFLNGKTDVGIGGIGLKQMDDYCFFRAEASINGIKPVEGFDRSGAAMVGLQFNFVDWAHVFAVGGAVINPSMAQKAGLTGSAGLGFSCNFGKWSGLMAEGGYEALQNGAKVNNMFFARIGYYVRPGITERDRVNIDIDRHVREGYGELKQENQLLKTDLKRKQEEVDTLMSIQNRSLALMARLEKRLDDCNEQVAKATQPGTMAANSFSQIFFAKGSAEISPIEAGKVKQLANYINSTDGDFRIEGYASPEGSAYVNEELCGDRARAVYWMLIDLGVDIDRLIPMTGGVTTQYGDDSPLNRIVVVSASPY